MPWNELELDDEVPEVGCSWPIIENCTSDEDAEMPDSGDPSIKEWTEQMAIEILWAASGKQFGVCNTLYRPCRIAECEAGFPMIDAWNLVGRGGWLKWDPWGGSIFAQLSCACGVNRCDCTSVTALELWHKRVRSITEVKIDGQILDPAAYRRSKNRRTGRWELLRLDGEAWPSCQDRNVANGEVGSWSIAYQHGRPVPIGGRVAGGILACELKKAIDGDEDCELPRRVQTVARQGVSIAFIDPMLFLDKGLTGLYEVDLWLMSVNPSGLRRGARVYRVDDPRRSRRARR